MNGKTQTDGVTAANSRSSGVQEGRRKETYGLLRGTVHLGASEAMALDVFAQYGRGTRGRSLHSNPETYSSDGFRGPVDFDYMAGAPATFGR